MMYTHFQSLDEPTVACFLRDGAQLFKIIFPYPANNTKRVFHPKSPPTEL